VRVHIRRERQLSCPRCPFVTEFRHHLEYHLRNHVGSKPFRCARCDYACVNRSMLNSHAKSHASVYRYRCSDCSYATKYCHSLKLHLRKTGHRPAAVLNPDGSAPTDDGRAGPRTAPPVTGDGRRPPRTGPPSPPRRGLSSAGGGGVERAWSAEAQIGTTGAMSGPPPQPGESYWPPLVEEFRAATSPRSSDPYAFIADDDVDSLTRKRADEVDGVMRQRPAVLLPVGCDDDVAGPRDDATRRRRNAEFVARLTADIEAELVAEDRPLDLTCAAASDAGSGVVATSTVVAADEDAGAASAVSASSPSSSSSSDASRRRLGVAHRRAADVAYGDGMTLWSTAVEGDGVIWRERSGIDSASASSPCSSSDASRRRKGVRAGACVGRITDSAMTRWSSAVEDEGVISTERRGASVPLLLGSSRDASRRRQGYDDRGDGVTAAATTQWPSADEIMAAGEWPRDRRPRPRDRRPGFPVASRRRGCRDGVTEWQWSSADKEVAAGDRVPRRGGFVECRHCRIAFRDRVTYALHMGYHGFDAPFSCNMCGHRAADRVAFFVHIATAAH